MVLFLKGMAAICQLTTFQADQSVWHSIVLLGGDVFADDFQQVGQRHHGTAHNEIEELLFLLSTCMAESHVFSPMLLATSVATRLSSRCCQQDGTSPRGIRWQGNTGKPPPVPRSMMRVPGSKANHFSYTQ